MSELERENLVLYKSFVRLDAEMFHDIVEKVMPYIKKTWTPFRKPLEPALKVAVTLIFLATGTPTKVLGMRLGWAPTLYPALCPRSAKVLLQFMVTVSSRCPKMPTSGRRWLRDFKTSGISHAYVGP